MSIRVLIVDDSTVMREMITRRLRSEPQIEVIGSASDAIEAHQYIELMNPSVLILDVEMPGMDGLSFLRRVLTQYPLPIIIIASSTRAGSEAIRQALQLGAVGGYAKSTRDRSVRDDDGGELARLVCKAAGIISPTQG